MNNIDLTNDFLNGKIDKAIAYWRDNSVRNEWDANGGIKGRGCLKETYILHETEKGNLSFVLFNFLGLFNGHYEICVNPVTFEWGIRKYGTYQSLTTIGPSDDTKVYTKSDLTKAQVIEMEGHIANTLRFVFYSEFRRNCNVQSVSWQLFISGKVAEDLI